jgi:hypothetical protein
MAITDIEVFSGHLILNFSGKFKQIEEIKYIHIRLRLSDAKLLHF